MQLEDEGGENTPYLPSRVLPVQIFYGNNLPNVVGLVRAHVEWEKHSIKRKADWHFDL